jgi:hypothetical protein
VFAAGLVDFKFLSQEKTVLVTKTLPPALARQGDIFYDGL